jgi:hypothetical protein
MKKAIRSFEGKWNILDATFPTGSPAYTGILKIKRIGCIYELDWDITAGRYTGIGLRAGSHLFVSCGEQRAGLGLALFQVQKNKQVGVQWTSPELKGKIGGGRFQSGFGGSFDGEHELTQFLPDGSPHGEWNILIAKTGEVFNISWRKGKTVHFRGLGLKTPEGLAAGWYPDIHQLALMDYYFDPDNNSRLLASWALGESAGLGTEILEKA